MHPLFLQDNKNVYILYKCKIYFNIYIYNRILVHADICTNFKNIIIRRQKIKACST